MRDSNKSYTYFLNGCNPQTDSLVKMALEDFRDSSGLFSEILEQEQVRLFSGNGDTLKERLGFASFDGQSILKIARLVEIPSFAVDGTVTEYHFRLYPQIDGTRYLHPKQQPARPYIPRSVWELADKPHKPLWITEGAKKVLKLLQHNRPAIGLQGVWNFRGGGEDNQALFEELQAFNWKGRTVYLGFDSDLWTNPQVRFALYELSLKLMSKSAIVRFPKWTGAKGIDDYLVMQKNVDAALVELESKALAFDKFISIDHREELLRALRLTHMAFDDLGRESIVTTIAKRLSIQPKRLFVKLRPEKEIDAGPTEEERAAALELLRDPGLVNRFLEVSHTRYLGRDKTLLLVKLACLTRHLKRGLSIIISGTSSTGKSALIVVVLDTCDPHAYENFTRTSAQYLLYRQEPLDHRVVTYFELQGTGQTAAIIRTALSEGTLRLGTILKDSTGNLEARQIEKDTEGLVILSTHTGDKVDEELATRVLTQEMSHDEKLARLVYQHKARSNGQDNGGQFKVWQISDGMIEPLAVEVPFYGRFAELFPTVEERYHRDFDKVISLVKASALWHQYQREKTPEGAVIADERDYRLVYELSDTFTESILPVTQPVLKLLNLVKDNPDMTRREIQETLEVSKATIKRRINQAVRKGYMEPIGKGETQTFTVLDIPQPVTVLPAPEKIFTILCGEPVSQQERTLEAVGSNPAQGHLSQGEPMSQITGENEPNSSTAHSNGSTAQNGSTGGEPSKSIDTVGSKPVGSTAHEKVREGFVVEQEDDLPEVEVLV